MRDHLDQPVEQQRRLARPAHRTDDALGTHAAVSREGRVGVPSPAAVLGLQRSVGNAGTAALLAAHGDEREDAPSPVHKTIAESGSALDGATRSTMEQQLGADFSDVRLHVDRTSAESVQAAAYTVGNDIVVHPNHFSPGTASAQRTLAHELTHVRQQRSGPVDGTPAAGGVQVSDPADRFEREAEATASAVMSSFEATPSSSEVSGSAAPGGTLQRETEGDETEDEELG